MKTNDKFSLLVRLWNDTSREEPAWRASIEDPTTGERKGFASLEALIQFLRSITQTDSPDKEQDDQNPGG